MRLCPCMWCVCVCMRVVLTVYYETLCPCMWCVCVCMHVVLKVCLHVTDFSLFNGLFYLISIVFMKNGQNGLKHILSVFSPSPLTQC